MKKETIMPNAATFSFRLICTMVGFAKKKNTIPGHWFFKIFKNGSPFKQLPGVYVHADNYGGWCTLSMFFPNRYA